jgi:hypothetical protein
MSADMVADTSPSPDGAMGTLSGTWPMQTVSTDASGAAAPVIRGPG